MTKRQVSSWSKYEDSSMPMSYGEEARGNPVFVVKLLEGNIYDLHSNYESRK